MRSSFLNPIRRVWFNIPLSWEDMLPQTRKVLRRLSKVGKKIKILWDKPWRYEPHFTIVIKKKKKNPRLEDHERRRLEKRLANKYSWLEVKAILEAEMHILPKPLLKSFLTHNMTYFQSDC